MRLKLSCYKDTMLCSKNTTNLMKIFLVSQSVRSTRQQGQPFRNYIIAAFGFHGLKVTKPLVKRTTHKKAITKNWRSFFKKKNFMAPFYGWGSTASRLEPLRGGSLLFTTKFPEVPGTHFIDLGRMKG